jgi:hypothetical protein
VSHIHFSSQYNFLSDENGRDEKSFLFWYNFFHINEDKATSKWWVIEEEEGFEGIGRMLEVFVTELELRVSVCVCVWFFLFFFVHFALVFTVKRT